MKKICVRKECRESFETNDPRKVYCSRSCAAKVNNRLFPKRIRSGNKNCLKCQSLLIESQEKFCSRKCSTSYRRDSYISDWLCGRNNGSHADGSMSSTVRKYLLEKSEYKCQSPTCAVPGGWSVPNPTLGRPILTIDHIDGNWKNNSVDNLIVLCYSCHTLTPTFGALNIGNGQGVRGSGNRAYKPH